jgi:phosphatidylglycerol:prolipoprotein diacylglycerol transferase
MPEGFYIGSFFVRFYGIVIMVGALAGGFLAQKEAERKGHDPDTVWDLMVWLIIGGIVGARLWHVFTPPPSSIAMGITTKYYLTHPLALINTRNGGLGIPGAVMGGALALYLFTKKHNLSFGAWADFAAPGLALGQAIGRWGNFFNQELYGAPTNLPWKLYIDPVHRLPGFESVSYYHPLFLYEMLWNLGNMAVLLWISHRLGDKLKNGDVFLAYLVIYPIGRFFLDFLRLDASRIEGVNANQTLMVIVALSSIIALWWRHRMNRASE